jgi:hypothetical protein
MPRGSGVSEEEIDIVVAQIRRITRTANLEFALRVGAVVLHNFYNGDTETWRSRGRKLTSFRRLAAHPELPLSAGALYRCVALYELCERFNAPNRWTHLGASHLRLVLALPPADQESMLATANQHQMTVQALRAAICRTNSCRTSRGGRQAQCQMTKALRTAHKCLNERNISADDLRGLSNKDISESQSLVDSVRQSLEQLSLLLCAAREEGVGS